MGPPAPPQAVNCAARRLVLVYSEQWKYKRLEDYSDHELTGLLAFVVVHVGYHITRVVLHAHRLSSMNLEGVTRVQRVEGSESPRTGSEGRPETWDF